MVDVHHNQEIDPIYKNIRVILDTLIDKSSFGTIIFFTAPATRDCRPLTSSSPRSGWKFLNMLFIYWLIISGNWGAVGYRRGDLQDLLGGRQFPGWRLFPGRRHRDSRTRSLASISREVIETCWEPGPTVSRLEPQTSDKKEVAIGLTIPSESLKKTHSSSRFDTFSASRNRRKAQQILWRARKLRHNRTARAGKECYEKYVDRYINCKDSPFAYGDHNPMNL